MRFEIGLVITGFLSLTHAEQLINLKMSLATKISKTIYGAEVEEIKWG